MKLRLAGHAHRYATEQILLQTLDNVKAEFTDEAPDEGEDYAVITLNDEGQRASASAEMRLDGAEYFGCAEVDGLPFGENLTADEELALRRAHQRILKLAFFRAARQASTRELPWGATTGVRPSTLVTRMVRAGIAPERAAQIMTDEYYVTPERAALALDAARAELDAAATLDERDIALYVGIPFCPTRCAYCSFVSNSVEKSMKIIEPFLTAIFDEATATAEAIRDQNVRIAALYIGGGTPTTLTAAMLDALLGHLAATFDLSHLREYTVEAGRPDTFTEEKLAVLKSHGVTRISVNPQTMRDEVLTAIGRHHDAQDTYRATELAKSAGFDVINMDLIAGLPGDTFDGFAASLDEVIALAPENITVHTLSLKRGSRVTLEKTPVPQGKEVSAMLTHASERLRRAGYAPYYLYRQKFTSGGFENVGWCRRGTENLYNIIMMDEIRPVLALGAGVTKLVRTRGKLVRIFNPKYPFEYIERIEDIKQKKQEIREFFAQG